MTLHDVFSLRVLFVNVCFVGDPDAANPDWVLIDAGVGGQAERIFDKARDLYGETAPRAIILTHGHFDHVGTLMDLLSEWDVPVYAHPLEFPYLIGEESYPEADPSVGGGLMALVSPIYPNAPIDISGRLQPLPQDGSAPFMPGWRWIHTPGHTPGHISLFRESDRVMITGDAFISVKQESALAVLTQEKEIHGPPAYFTTDWGAARESVRKLEALKPAAAFTGHGQPMFGDELTAGLEKLAREFATLAVPEHGRYVDRP